jgi:hypothetical protein
MYIRPSPPSLVLRYCIIPSIKIIAGFLVDLTIFAATRHNYLWVPPRIPGGRADSEHDTSSSFVALRYYGFGNRHFEYAPNLKTVRLPRMLRPYIVPGEIKHVLESMDSNGRIKAKSIAVLWLPSHTVHFLRTSPDSADHRQRVASRSLGSLVAANFAL